MTTPPPDKPMSQRRIAQEKRETKAREKAVKAEATSKALAECKRLGKLIPAEFSTWGVIRTQAWEQSRARCAEVAAFKRPNLAKMQKAIRSITQACNSPVEKLAERLYGSKEQKAAANV